MLKTRLLLLPLIARAFAPGPVIVRFVIFASTPLVRIIVPESPDAKLTVMPEVAFAIASRREQLLASHTPSFVSTRVLTSREFCDCAEVCGTSNPKLKARMTKMVVQKSIHITTPRFSRRGNIYRLSKLLQRSNKELLLCRGKPIFGSCLVNRIRSLESFIVIFI